MKNFIDIGKGIQVGIVNITPEQAAKMLERNTKNRHITESRVNHYASLMAIGDWMLNGDTIRFNRSGELIDGQHRLKAIIKSNVAIECIVMTGLNPEVFKNIDTARPRNGADAISIEVNKTGIYSKSISALITKILMHERSSKLNIMFANRGQSFGKVNETVTNDQVISYYRNHKPTIDNVVDFCMPYRNKTKRLLVLSTLMFVFWKLRQLNIEVAEEFYSKLATGENISMTNPIYQLREKLIAIKASENNPPSWHFPAYIYKAWNAYRKGHEIKSLRIKSNENEPVKPI